MAHEKAWLHRLRFALPGLTIALFVLLVWGQPKTQQAGGKLWAALVGLLPEFIGALLATSAVYWLWRNDEHAGYVAAMRSVRSAVKYQISNRQLTTASARELMKDVVGPISELHFGSTSPPVGLLKRQNFVKNCFTCGALDEEVLQGRCTRCHDIADSWSEADETASQCSAH